MNIAVYPINILLRSCKSLQQFNYTEFKLQYIGKISSGYNSTLADTHFTVPRRIKGWVGLGTAVRVRSPCPSLQ